MSKPITSFFQRVEPKKKREEGEDVKGTEKKEITEAEEAIAKNNSSSAQENVNKSKDIHEGVLGKRKAAVEEQEVSVSTNWVPVEQLGSWKGILQTEFSKKYFVQLDLFLEKEASQKKIYPPRHLIFSAFSSCAFDDIKVVIIGQDPYHGPNQAHGLAFSVMRPERPPPSLKNIYKEVKSNFPSFSIPSHGDLTGWSKQGVFLLNTCLTVQHGNANSHKKKGWEEFISAVIKAIDRKDDGVVFLLWGKPANERCSTINRLKHRVISSSHPSPLGAAKTNTPFLGSKCFAKCNEELLKMGKEPIDWCLL